MATGEGRGRETQLDREAKKTRGSSKSRQAGDIATLMAKVEALEEALHGVANRVNKVEGDFETLETHTLGQLDNLRSDLDSHLNVEEE